MPSTKWLIFFVTVGVLSAVLWGRRKGLLSLLPGVASE